MVLPFEKSVWKFLRKINMYQPYYPAIPSLGIYPREMENTKTFTSMFMITLFIIHQTGNNLNDYYSENR